MMPYERVKWETIEVGDLVRLKYSGYHRVPLWLDNDWAEVVGKNRVGNLIVQASIEQKGYTRTVQHTDLCNHKKPER